MKKHDNKPLLCILTENYQREFSVKLYIALHAVKRGYQVILTEQNTSISRRVKDCILLHKDHAKWSEVFYRGAKSRRLITAALDEEALIVGNDETYLRSRVFSDLISKLDAVFVWGDTHFDILKKNLKKDTNLFITGSPKFDLCNIYKKKKIIKKDQEKIRKVLICTRFSYTNPLNNSVEEIENELIKLGYYSQKERHLFADLIKTEFKIQKEFESLAEFLGSNSNLEVVIRPHPAEDRKIYDNIAANFNNMLVDNKTDLRVQILESDCLIHDGCTTAIEARAMGALVFGLRPNNLANAYDDYTNQYSKNFFCHETLAEYIKTTKIKDIKMGKIDLIARKGIANWDKSENFCVNKILDVFDEMGCKKLGIFKPNLLMRLEWKTKLYKIISDFKIISFLLKWLFPKKFTDFMLGYEISEKFFQDKPTDAIRKEIDQLLNVDSSLNDIYDLKIEHIARKTYLLY